MARKAKSRIREEIEFLNNVHVHNAKAKEDGPIKKKWTLHDLGSIKALTPAQEDMFHAWFNNKHLCAYGTAGTGKTFLALYLAFRDILDQRFEPNHVIIVRSNVSTRELGHRPGTTEEKMADYEIPYRDICAELFGRPSTYDDMKRAGMIEFQSTSFVRGRTWNKAIVIIEEGQNLNFHEMNSIMTRIGLETRVIFTGDKLQSDLPFNGRDKSGIGQFIEVINEMDRFETIRFTKHDIVRSEFVRSWIEAVEVVTAAA